MPCVRIEDRPALRWRILSDDVSRGPLPTMRYFEERIRTIAAFKMNGYSPYMEHVFVSPTDPLPAPLDGITPAQLRDAGELRAQVSRGADSRTAELRAHAQHAARRAICRRSGAAARVSAVAERRAVDRSISRASLRKSSRRWAGRRSSTSVPTKRRRSGWGRRRRTSRPRTLAGIRGPHRRDEPPHRAVGRADHALGRRHRGRSRNHEADSALGGHRQLALRRRDELRART